MSLFIGPRAKKLKVIFEGAFREVGELRDIVLEITDDDDLQQALLDILRENQSPRDLIYRMLDKADARNGLLPLLRAASTLYPKNAELRREITELSREEVKPDFDRAAVGMPPPKKQVETVNQGPNPSQGKLSASRSARELWHDPVPFFPGLATWPTERCHAFGGRQKETEEVAQGLLNKQALMVTGPSGAGKSSLISAGVIPHLRELNKISGYLAFRARDR
jgi:hypothetical protein